MTIKVTTEKNKATAVRDVDRAIITLLSNLEIKDAISVELTKENITGVVGTEVFEIPIEEFKNIVTKFKVT